MMFDPDFDPLRELKDCQLVVDKLSGNIQILVNAHNTNNHNINELIKENRRLTAACNNLHRRINLLESEIHSIKTQTNK
jgi:hypothetical protein